MELIYNSGGCSNVGFINFYSRKLTNVISEKCVYIIKDI